MLRKPSWIWDGLLFVDAGSGGREGISRTIEDVKGRSLLNECNGEWVLKNSDFLPNSQNLGDAKSLKIKEPRM